MNNGNIVLTDFVSAIKIDDIDEELQTRYYRAPEVILELPYDEAIDIWSFGCILCELYSGEPLFPGENEHQQLLCMMEILGPPPIHMIDHAKNKKNYFNQYEPIIVADKHGIEHLPSTKTFLQVLKSKNTEFVRFVKRCLTWDPKERITPEEALNDPWIRNISTILNSSKV